MLLCLVTLVRRNSIGSLAAGTQRDTLNHNFSD